MSLLFFYAYVLELCFTPTHPYPDHLVCLYDIHSRSPEDTLSLLKLANPYLQREQTYSTHNFITCQVLIILL